MERELVVTYTRCAKGNPLAIVHNLPYMDTVMTPDQMKVLGAALLWAADECKRVHSEGKVVERDCLPLDLKSVMRRPAEPKRVSIEELNEVQRREEA